MTMTIEMPESLARRVRAKCAREGRGVGDVAVAVFAAWLDGGTRTRSVKSLKGVLPPREAPVSLEEMDQAIAEAAGAR